MAGLQKPADNKIRKMEAPSSKELLLFYKTPTGKRLDKEIAGCVTEFLLDKKLAKRYLLCIGHPIPSCLPLFRKAKSYSVLTPLFQGPKKLVDKGLNKTVLSDETHLPFINVSFDIAIIFHAIEYMDDPTSFFEELWKVLAPGGRIILMIPNRKGGWKKAGIPHAHTKQGFSYVMVRDFLFEKGFECIDCRGIFHGLKIIKGKRPILEGILKLTAKKGPGIMPGFLIIEAEKLISVQGKETQKPTQLAPTTPVPT